MSTDTPAAARQPVSASTDAGPARTGAGIRSVVLGPLTRAVILIAAAIGVIYNLVGFPGLRQLGSYYRIDLDVYRIGGTALANGVALYGQMPPTALGKSLPFTYPPLAAIVFSPMSAISLGEASTALTALSLVLLFATAVVTLTSIGALPERTLLWTAGAAFAGALVLEPVYSTLDYGQINIVLMALVAADCLLKKTPWPRGALVGLVAAVKLTPAVFVLYFLLRKDFRAVLVTAVGFAAGTAVGFAVSFTDSRQYWTDTLIDSNRIGRPAYPANQSITGMLARLGLDPSLRTPLWMLASVVVLIVTALAARRALSAGMPALALSVTALFGLLVSPVSWSHHWVWVVPTLLVLGHLAYTRRSLGWALWVAAGAALFVVAPHWLLTPGRTSGLGWPLWDQFLASSYVWWGLATLVLVAAVGVTGSATRIAADERSRVPAPVA
ncbi:glycosyltransferase 87 family protein [Rhodococcus daqingensis]|uniref:Glycosyltransferase 87 family protein n=1 Tax=Rhodococcus daqingensis TaxID=2479363 RepID=A0ABW2RTJ3_9NOCA